MKDYEFAFNQVSHLVMAIAKWESKNGSAALILPHEYDRFITHYVMPAMVFSSPRGALSSLGIKYEH
jgi:hypothetical protein